MLNRLINTEYLHLIKTLGLVTLVEEIPRSVRGNYQWTNDRA